MTELTVRAYDPSAASIAARRRRARRFWGAVGAMLRFEDRRPETAPAYIRIRSPHGMPARVDARVWRGN